MKNVLTIFKKEFRSYFNSPVGYIFITVYLVLTNWLFFQSFFIVGQADMRSYFGVLPWAFLFFVPAITMRLWSEEKKLGVMASRCNHILKPGHVNLTEIDDVQFNVSDEDKVLNQAFYGGSQ